MQRASWFVVLAFGAVACGSNVADEKREKDSEEGKGTVVTLDGYSSRAPAGWKQEKPSNEMRVTQFVLPRVKDDKTDADVVIYRSGGSAKDNVKRWKSQWAPPAGKDLDDVAKVSEIKVGGHDATLLDIRGTYNSPPFDPKYRGKPQKDFRMLALQWQAPDNSYQIKLTGPADTVEHYAKGFEDWLKGFKKE